MLSLVVSICKDSIFLLHFQIYFLGKAYFFMPEILGKVENFFILDNILLYPTAPLL